MCVRERERECEGGSERECERVREIKSECERERFKICLLFWFSAPTITSIFTAH